MPGRLSHRDAERAHFHQAGRGTILELIDATRSRYELQQIRTDLAGGLLEAQVRLLALRGTLDQAASAQ